MLTLTGVKWGVIKPQSFNFDRRDLYEQQEILAKAKKEEMSTSFEEHCKYNLFPSISFVSDLSTNEYLNTGLLVLNAVWVDPESFGWMKNVRTLAIKEFPALTEEELKKYLLSLTDDFSDHQLKDFLSSFDIQEEKLKNRSSKNNVDISDPNRNHNNNNHNNELQSQLQSQQVQSPSQLCNSISSVDIHHPSS